MRTTVGQVLFNQVLPTPLRFNNEEMTRSKLGELIDRCYRELGPVETAHLVDGIKSIGFTYATRGGMTISIADISVPPHKKEMLGKADADVTDIDRQFQRGLITDDERYEQVVQIWQRTTQDVSNEMMEALDPRGPLTMMTRSGARGNKGNIGQLGGMRGLMADPSGRIIDVPVRSNFREGMTVLEYFISTHGARKGLADTALRTADSGYLTRRLVDVAQDVIIRDDDCGTLEGTLDHARRDGRVRRLRAGGVRPPPGRPPGGRRPAAIPTSGEVLVERNVLIDEETAHAIDESGLSGVLVRSPLTCASRYGVCRACYGRNLATGSLVGIGEAVGIIAAQSIGEPGTQLTMRTFHTGGVAGLDITAGLPRVEELFEARVPKGKAGSADIDGEVEIIQGENGARRVKVTSREAVRHPARAGQAQELLLEPGDSVEATRSWPASRAPRRPTNSRSPVRGVLVKAGKQLSVHSEDVVEREYADPAQRHACGSRTARTVKAGDADHRGLDQPAGASCAIRGREAVQRYLVDEVQKVYRSQGVTINDKHIEVIVRQMLRKVRIDKPGDTELLPGELVDRFDYEEVNAQVLAEGGEPATAQTCCSASPRRRLNTEQLPGRGLLPGDHPRAHRGRDQRRQGPPARPQGERHHRQAHPRRDGRAGRRRRSPRGGSVAALPRHLPVASCRRASARSTTPC